ncbi:MAG: RNA methyltransferase [Micavibrio sp.]|nr:RNA methyltransferase [Micavibrio sp.]
MRGFFGIGVEEISKEQNVGTIARSTHAFGGSFFFTIKPDVDVEAMRTSDTSGAFDHLPYYQYANPSELALPDGCTLVGVELTEDAVDLCSFRHPLRAAYIFGPEMGHLSQEMQAKCAHIIKIPMKFCVNVGVAAAITMYDRQLSLGRHAERPVKTGGSLENPEKIKSDTLRRKIRSKK